MSRTNKHLHGIRILHEDPDILIVDKPPGLLTIASDKERTKTAYRTLTDYVRKGQAKSRKRVFIVHRLDRETSGLLVFAKTVAAKRILQSRWDEVEKTYLAVVHGCPPETEGSIRKNLAENRAFAVYVSPEGKEARTDYTLLKRTRKLSLLEVRLRTGRKHQIRVHLASAGMPVLGDGRYGQKRKSQPRLALHAVKIAFRHPRTGETVVCESKVPEYFHRLLG